MSRGDLHLGPLHVIARPYRAPAQYGALVWREYGRGAPVLDVWIRQTLYTLRRAS